MANNGDNIFTEIHDNQYVWVWYALTWHFPPEGQIYNEIWPGPVQLLQQNCHNLRNGWTRTNTQPSRGQNKTFYTCYKNTVVTKKKSLWVSLSPIVTSIWFYPGWVTFIGSNWIATREHSLWYQFSFAFRLKTAMALCRLQSSYLLYFPLSCSRFTQKLKLSTSENDWTENSLYIAICCTNAS